MTDSKIAIFDVESKWPFSIKGGNHLSEPVTYDGVRNLINEAVKEINETNVNTIASITKQVEKMCKSNLDLSESKCLAKAFVTENVKEKFYENITNTKKAHERIDNHLLSHKNMSGLIKWLITITATSGWVFSLIKYLITELHKINP